MSVPFQITRCIYYFFLNIPLINTTNLSEFSCPYTSQPNCRVERKLRHILHSVHAMLISVSCPECIWGEASLTAVHIINRLPSSVFGNISPFECLYHTAPDYNSLKVFCCACFVLLQPHCHTPIFDLFLSF